MRIQISLLATTILATSAGLAAQAKPDFSGDWVLARDRSSQTMSGSVVVSVSGLLGDKFTAVQDAKTLSLTITVVALGRDIKAVYNLDGSESKNLNPGGNGQPDEPIFSRTSWDGSRLVIETRGSPPVNGKPLETKRVIWIDSEGFLTIERSAEGSPVLRSVYRKSKQTKGA
jgi:hypothetical protein